MVNAGLVELEKALMRERLTMRRQELLRQIWHMTRGDEPGSAAGGQFSSGNPLRRQEIKSRTQVASSQREKSPVRKETASTAV